MAEVGPGEVTHAEDGDIFYGRDVLRLAQQLLRRHAHQISQGVWTIDFPDIPSLEVDEEADETDLLDYEKQAVPDDVIVTLQFVTEWCVEQDPGWYIYVTRPYEDSETGKLQLDVTETYYFADNNSAPLFTIEAATFEGGLIERPSRQDMPEREKLSEKTAELLRVTGQRYKLEPARLRRMVYGPDDAPCTDLKRLDDVWWLMAKGECVYLDEDVSAETSDDE